MAGSAKLRNLGTDNATVIIPKMPKLPDDVKKRFPSLAQWEMEMEEWRVKATNGITGVNR